MVPVTKTRSPGRAPPRLTVEDDGAQPIMVAEKLAGPGVLTVSPPSREISKMAWSRRSPATKASRSGQPQRSDQ
ncbi:hypothetical protein D3C72_2315000 [compost metagenome]